jgi:curli biogenesis system outer membrane secretion channel CsgG
MSRKPILLAFTSLFLATMIRSASAEENSLPTMFVAPFGADRTAISYWQPAVGSGLAEMLVTELGKINKFTMLENSQLDALKDEMKLGDDGFVSADEKVEKGGWAGADFMFTAKVTQFGNKESKVNLGGFVPGSFGNLGVRQGVSNVRIDWRLVDAATRKIVKTGAATGEQKGTSFSVGTSVNGRGGGIGFDNKEFMDSALGKATVKALADIVSEVSVTTLPESGRQKQKGSAAGKQAAAAAALKAAPGKVIAVAGKGALIVSLGGKQGFKAGDTLNLYETVDTKDDKGEVVFTEEKLVGEVTIQSVQDERSKASCEASLNVKAGWVVKVK